MKKLFLILAVSFIAGAGLSLLLAGGKSDLISFNVESLAQNEFDLPLATDPVWFVNKDDDEGTMICTLGGDEACADNR